MAVASAPSSIRMLYLAGMRTGQTVSPLHEANSNANPAVWNRFHAVRVRGTSRVLINQRPPPQFTAPRSMSLSTVLFAG